MAEYKKNNWVTFLRQYGPIANNDNLFDEHTANCAKRNNVRQLRFDDGGLIDELVGNFHGERPCSVILTGTAGEGKTWLCRELWEALGGDLATWSRGGKFSEMTLPCGATLCVFKDLSELKPDDLARLAPMADAIFDQGTTDVYLVAANDGQLLSAWNQLAPSEATSGSFALIEDLVIKGVRFAERERLKLYNLSRRRSAERMERVLDALAEHEGWQRCDGCAGKDTAVDRRCPIWENHERLQDPLVRERLADLFELGDRSGFHVPVRQLLIVATNMLLGHPDAKEDLLRCADIPDVVTARSTHHASLYRNAFGENLPESRRRRGSVFSTLRRFGVGEETSNRIDNLLIYGQDDPSMSELFQELLGADKLYGAHEDFKSHLEAYLGGNDPEKAARFTDVIVAQRQRLFFTMPRARAVELALWELTVFQHAGEYLAQVLHPLLRENGRVAGPIVKRIVRGLNRVFTGTLTVEGERLWLASSGSHSQARVCRIFEHSVPVDPERGCKITFEPAGDAVELVVQLDRRVRVAMPLHLVRYEFLARVADGALPSNFSRECYEDVLSFKSRLLRAWRQLEVDEGDADGFKLKVLTLQDQGELSVGSINLRMERA